MTTTCTKCFVSKDIVLFRKSIRTKTGFSSWCKDCSKILDKTIRNQKKLGIFKPKKNMGPSLADRKVKYLNGLNWCSECKQWLNLDVFPKNKRTINGIDNKCKSCAINRSSKRNQIPEVIYRTYQRQAAYRKIEFCLTHEQFMQFWQLNCSYCGNKIKTIGIDRVDSNQGYVLNNCVSCCSICNLMKNDLDKDQFILHIKQICDYATYQ